MKIIVKNNTTAEALEYDNLVKARIAVDYLNINTPHRWFLVILPV